MEGRIAQASKNRCALCSSALKRASPHCNRAFLLHFGLGHVGQCTIPSMFMTDYHQLTRPASAPFLPLQCIPSVSGGVRGLQEHRLLTTRPAGSCKADNRALQAGGGNGGGGNSGCKHLGGNDDGEGSLPKLSFGWLLLLSGLNFAGPAHALFKKKKKPAVRASTEVDKLLDLSWPIVKNLGFSGVLGATAAFAFKTVGKSLALVVGIIFGIIQVGAYLGYVKVDWARVHRDVIKSFDVNQDGKLDATDLKALSASLLAVLSQGVPSVGGFCAGFTLGLSL